MADLQLIENQHYFAVLGMTVEHSRKTGKPMWPGVGACRAAWRESVRLTHPDNNPGADPERQDQRFRRVMEAGRVLTCSSLREDYIEHLEGSTQGWDGGHALWLRGERHQVYSVHPLPDWMEVLLRDSVEHAAISRGDYEDWQAALGCVDTSELPSIIAGERVAGVPELDVQRIITALLDRHEIGLFDLRCFLRNTGSRVAVTWRRKHAKSHGALVKGRCRKLSDRDRARMPGPDTGKPYYEVELALDIWLVMDAEERTRLVFHELLHAAPEDEKPKLRPHDIETFADEVEVYGVGSQAEAEYVAAALRSPDIAERLAHYGVLDGGQLVLFRQYVDEARDLEETEARPGETPADTARRAGRKFREQMHRLVGPGGKVTSRITGGEEVTIVDRTPAAPASPGCWWAPSSPSAPPPRSPSTSSASPR